MVPLGWEQMVGSHPVRTITFSRYFPVLYYLCIVLAEGEKMITWNNRKSDPTLEQQLCLSYARTHYGSATGKFSLECVHLD